MSNISNDMAETTAKKQVAVSNLSFLRVLRAEALKLRTLLSNWVILLCTLVILVGIAMAYTLALNSMAKDPELAMVASQQAASSGMGTPSLENLVYASGSSGVDLAVILIGALAVVFIGNEYSTRAVTSTLTAAPKRSVVYLAKLTLLSAVAFVVGCGGAAASYAAAYPLFNETVQDAAPFVGGIAISWLGTGIYFVMIAWIGFGFGALLRNSPGGIVLVVALLFLLPVLVSLFKLWIDWVEELQNYLVPLLGQLIMQYEVPDDAAFTRLEAMLILGAIAGAIVIAGWARFRFTDPK